MKREDFIKHIENEGWKLPERMNAADRWIKEIAGRTYGYKLSRIAVRLEIKVVHEKTAYSAKKTEWVRLRSGYLKQMYFDGDGKIAGMKK